MVAPEQGGWDLALASTDAASRACQLANRMLHCDVGLLEGLPQLQELLRSMGGYDRGDFEGEFAALSFMLLDIEPYLPEAGGTANEQAARWVPTVVARHRPAVLEACRRVLARYSASTLRRA